MVWNDNGNKRNGFSKRQEITTEECAMIATARVQIFILPPLPFWSRSLILQNQRKNDVFFFCRYNAIFTEIFNLIKNKNT